MASQHKRRLTQFQHSFLCLAAWLLLIAPQNFGCQSARQLSPLAAIERQMIFQPTEFPSELEGQDIPFEDVTFQSGDGTALHGWFADHEDPVAIALFCHGNAGNIASRGNSLMILNRRHRLAVMTFDYRGFGKSEGRPTEKGILADARAARKWLAKRKGIDESQIVLMGRSLGGAVAVDLATDGAAGLVVASTFSSAPEVAKRAMPWLPTKILMTQKFDSLSKIGMYRGPLLQTHGDADQVIPIELGQKLFDAAPGPKEFIVIENGDHNSPQSDRYREALDRFLAGLNLPGPN